MQDRIPLYPGRVKMTPVAGQANTFDMVRADDPTQPGTPLNKATLLKDATAALYGLGNTATPDNVLAELGKYKQYWWRRRIPKTTGYIEKLTDITEIVTLSSGTWSFYKTATISQTDGTISLSNQVILSGLNADIVVAQAPVYCTKNGTNVIYLVPNNATAYTNASGSYYDSSKTVVSYDYDDMYYVQLSVSGNPRAQVVSSQYVVGSPGDWQYLQSSTRSAYPDSGTQDGYEYEYLGIPFDNAVTAPKIETGSYVGTGVHGQANPNTLTFGFAPKVWGIYAIDMNKTGTLYGQKIFTAYGKHLGFYIDQAPHQYGSFVTYNGNSVSWYSDDVNGQLNNQYNEYYYFALG